MKASPLGRSSLVLPLSASLVIAACGDDGGELKVVSRQSARSQAEDPTNNSSRSLPPVPPRARGWQLSALKRDSAIDCGMTPLELATSGAPRVAVDDDVIYVGYEQVSGDNQDPRVIRVSRDKVLYCLSHEQSSTDGQAVAVTWDGGEFAYVVYTLFGGESELNGVKGWLPSYAPGAAGGRDTAVTFLGRMAAKEGSLASGTFITPVPEPKGATGRSARPFKSHLPVMAVSMLEGGVVEFRGDASHKPIDASGSSSMACPDEHGHFSSLYRLSGDLMALRCAEAADCESSRPCK